MLNSAKKIPCNSCVRRGCSTVCPYGSVINDQGSRCFPSSGKSLHRLTRIRFILTETEDLHLKISKMTQRIHQLEEALALLQSNISSEIHPLLQNEISSSKHGTEQPPSDMSGFQDDIYANVVDAFGTLTIGDSGEVRYFGASAGSEVCCQNVLVK